MLCLGRQHGSGAAMHTAMQAIPSLQESDRAKRSITAVARFEQCGLSMLPYIIECCPHGCPCIEGTIGILWVSCTPCFAAPCAQTAAVTCIRTQLNASSNKTSRGVIKCCSGDTRSIPKPDQVSQHDTASVAASHCDKPVPGTWLAYTLIAI